MAKKQKKQTKKKTTNKRATTEKPAKTEGTKPPAEKKQTEKKKPTIVKSKLLRVLRLQLTEKEGRQLKAEHLGAQKAITDINSEFREVQKGFEKRMSEQRARITKVSGSIKSGYQDREVECEEIFDYELRTVSVVRLDAGTTISNRSMTATEQERRSE